MKEFTVLGTGTIRDVALLSASFTPQLPNTPLKQDFSSNLPAEVLSGNEQLAG